MELKVQSERVRQAAEMHPGSKAALETLFPEAFEEGKVFCKIGQLFFRKTYPKNIYAIMERNQQVIVVNITHGSTWNTGNLKTYQLKTEKQVSFGEFRQISKYQNLQDFVIIDESAIEKLKEILSF